jgi:hypothetical protein
MAKKHKLLALGLALLALPVTPADADPGGDKTLPRLETPICAGVIGLQVQAAVQLIDRVRQNAERLGLPLADADVCEPNVLVAFVADGDTVVDKLMSSQPGLFDSLTLSERRALRDSGDPVRAWNIIATRTRDGMTVSRREGLDTVPRAQVMAAHSKIYTATRQDIVSSIVLFDSARTQGMTTVQLADYASMRAFASDFSAQESGKATILSLFGGGSARPAELTDGDLAFLTALYSGIPNLPATTKERQIEVAVGG